MLPAIIGAIGSVASSVGGSLLSNAAARKNAEVAYERQRQLTLDTPQLNVDGMRRAGLSPAMLNGGSFSAASSPAQAQTQPYNLGDPSIFANIAQSLAAAAANNAAARNTETQNDVNEQEARRKKMENDIKENEIAAWKSTHPNYIEYPDGTRFYENDPNKDTKINEFEKNHPEYSGKGEVVAVPKPMSEVSYNAMYANSKRDAEVSLWRLQTAVNNMKLADEETMKALAGMDKAQYNQLVAAAAELQARKLVDDETIKKLKSETDLNRKRISEIDVDIMLKKFEKTLMELDYNEKQNLGLGNLVKDWQKNGFTLSTLGKIMLSLIASNVNMSLSRRF